MQQFEKSNLKVILHSKRANIYFLEKCRVMQKNGRVLYLTKAEKENHYFNIPIANTTVILLGTGTSITQGAVRMLAQASVLVGFCGGGGTPLFMGGEIEWLTPQSEYRPTEYVQGWLSFWFDDIKRFEIGKSFQLARLDFIEQVWRKDRDLRNEGFNIEDVNVNAALQRARLQIQTCRNVTELLLNEANLTKQLYKFAASICGISGFARAHDSIDKANIFLNHGNYLAYGLAAVTLWVLGIPHGFAVMHGKTRRGALVFDVADLIKDALVLPISFLCAKENATEQEFRQHLLQKFIEHKSLDFLFNQVKSHALRYAIELKQIEEN